MLSISFSGVIMSDLTNEQRLLLVKAYFQRGEPEAAATRAFHTVYVLLWSSLPVEWICEQTKFAN